MAPETARVGTADPRTDVYALGVMFYEMLTGTVPFSGETPVDVMLKLVSEPVVPPRKRAPGIEITDEAEQLIMKALSKDPRRRHQSMDELFRELQTCYGSVRYRRSIQSQAEPDKEITRPGPIPLQKVKRPFADPAATGSTPPGTIALRPPTSRPGAPAPVPVPSQQGSPRQPILLTKRKERTKTLPLGVGRTPTPAPPPGPPIPRLSYPARPPVTKEIDATPPAPTALLDDIDVELDGGEGDWSDVSDDGAQPGWLKRH
jgi:serine/threonine protein kinase